MPRVLNFRIDGCPEGSVYIGRAAPGGWRQSKWHNPYREGKDGTREEVIEKFEQYLCDSPALLDQINELRGKNLVCWCAPLPCHGDVLLVLANR